MKVVTAEQMMRIDRECEQAGLPTSRLMENAGKAFAGEVRRILGTAERQPVLMLIGPGNNGGDGLVAARYLHDWGARVSLYLFGQRKADDPNLRLVRERDIACTSVNQSRIPDGLDKDLAAASAVVDALFGTGSNRPLGGSYARALERINKARQSRPSLKIIALDLPSGLNADSGAADPACLPADFTVTLGLPKLGLFNPPGSDMDGRISVVDIGIPPHLAEDIEIELIDAAWARSVLPHRPIGANKGTFGRVMVVAGSINYIGAAYLACMGAMRVGAGLVTLATPASLQPVMASKLTEATYLPLPESGPGVISPEAAGLIHQEIVNYDVLLIGCGLGIAQSTAEFIKGLLLNDNVKLPQLVVDADGLNILAGLPGWWRQLPDGAILTPHPGEMARLTGSPVEEVQSDRLDAAIKAARKWRQTVVLKGAYTVIAARAGTPRISPFANPGLASAGTGDVLAGAIAGLAAQGVGPEAAAACGVYLHGQAGEVVRERLGEAGMVASDLLPELPGVIKRLKEAG